MAHNVDVVIVGGGFAGLSAALRLTDEVANGTPRPTFVVLDGGKDPARLAPEHKSQAKALGGRTHSQPPAFDLGGGYVGSAQNYIQYLIRRFQIPLIPTHLPPDKVWLYQDANGTIAELPGNNPLALPGGMNAVFRLSDLDRLTLEVRDYLSHPWDSPHAERFDGMTVQEFIDGERAKYREGSDEFGMSEETAAAFTASVRSAFSLEPSELSFFFLLYYAAAAGSFAALVDVAGGEGAAEAFRFYEGTADLLGKMRKEIGTENVLLGAYVSEIKHADDGVEVISTKGTWTAKRVIVAMAPTMSDRIQYTPELETIPGGANRKNLCAEMAKCVARTIKGFVLFKRAFWRENGKSGYLLSVAGPPERYPLDWALDSVWSPAEAGIPPEVDGRAPINALMTFIPAAAASYWAPRTREERAQAIIRHLQEAFRFDHDQLRYSEPERLADNYVEFNWPAQAPAGMPSPAAMMPINTLSRYGQALRDPVGPIHWAGTESAREWCGYMDGAVESGFRAAAEVIAEIAKLKAAELKPAEPIAIEYPSLNGAPSEERRARGPRKAPSPRKPRQRRHPPSAH